MERDGLFGLMDDLRAGKPLPSLCDFGDIFARHAAKQVAEADRDLQGEKFHRALFGPDDAGYDTAPWLRGL